MSTLETEEVVPEVNHIQLATFVLDKLKELESRISEIEERILQMNRGK